MVYAFVAFCTRIHGGFASLLHATYRPCLLQFVFFVRVWALCLFVLAVDVIAEAWPLALIGASR